MLTITSRIVREVSFDPAGPRFRGRVELAFHDDIDDAPHVARLTVSQTMSHRTRFPQIEAALMDEAERQLRLRLAQVLPGTSNIFAPIAPAKSRIAA